MIAIAKLSQYTKCSSDSHSYLYREREIHTERMEEDGDVI